MTVPMCLPVVVSPFHVLRARPLAAPVAALLLASTAAGQSRQVPAPPQQRPVIIHGATVHPVSGPALTDGYIIFDKGVITHVGRGAVPQVAEATRVDGAGLHVYPGLIAAATQLGLAETGSLPVTIDYNELGRFKPEVRACVAVNPDSELIPVTRSNGILTGLVLPQSGLVSGRASAIRLDGWTWESMTIEPDSGLVVNWPRTEAVTERWAQRSEDDQRREMRSDLDEIERFFDDAAAYIAARDHDETVRTDQRYEALRPFLSGRKPVFVSAASIGQIESAVAWAVRRNLKIVIVGGAQADAVAPLLRKHDIPVIISGTHSLPRRRHAAYDESYTLPARLHEAGVRFCIASGAETPHERHLNHNAATAAAYGLPKEEALRAVTLSAAQIIGLGATHGALEPGRAATLIITTGDPLEITTDTLAAYIDGRRIDLGDRQKALYAKYREKYRQLGLLEG
jgi:imidazolonepropionase-like amidohydrolase